VTTGRPWRGAWPGVWLLRGVVVVGAVVALLSGVPEGYTPSVVFVVLVVVTSLYAAFRPEHLALSISMGVVIAWWTLHVRAEMPVGALVAAAGLTAAHVAATLLAYGPATLPVDPALALLWSMRAAMTWVAALAVWGVARAYAGHGSPTLFWLTGLAAAIVGAVLASVLTPLRGEDPRQ
jgi:hypothetical protein